MKKILSLAIFLTLLLSLTACGTSTVTIPPTTITIPVTTETAYPTNPQVSREEAIERLKTYIRDNAAEVYDVRIWNVYSGIEDVTVQLMLYEDVLSLVLIYEQGMLQTATTNSTRTTILQFSGQEGRYHGSQNNTLAMEEITASSVADYDLKPETFCVATDIEMTNFHCNIPDGGAKLTEEFTESFADGLHTGLEVFSDFLEESGLNLTLRDFGFDQYEVNPDRESQIRNGYWIKKS